MSEPLTFLSRQYPAVADVLRRQGGQSLRDYLATIRHQSLPDILPAQDLLDAVRDYFTPFFGEGGGHPCPAPVLIHRQPSPPGI